MPEHPASVAAPIYTAGFHVGFLTSKLLKNFLFIPQALPSCLRVGKAMLARIIVITNISMALIFLGCL